MGPWTDVGQNITVTYLPQVSFTFANVVSGGVTIVNLTQTGKPAPLGFLLLGKPPAYYDVRTTANYSGSITMTLMYSDSGLNSLEEKNMVLVQWNNTSGKWENITVGADTMHNLIFGETLYLSVFTVIVPCLEISTRMGSSIFLMRYNWQRPSAPRLPARNGIRKPTSIRIMW